MRESNLSGIVGLSLKNIVRIKLYQTEWREETKLRVEMFQMRASAALILTVALLNSKTFIFM